MVRAESESKVLNCGAAAAVNLYGGASEMKALASACVEPDRDWPVRRS